MARELELSQGRCTECNGVSDQNDKGTPQVMTPHSISSLQSSSPTCLLPPCECTGQGPLVSREGSFEDFYPQMSSPNASISSKSETCADTYPQGSSKFLSYSDIVKVPPKPTSKSPNKEDALYQDLKRRGNTNTSLDESEYRLNLFLRNLEPTMNEYKLYEICVQYVQFGPVMSCRTITSHGACVGLGFVMYIGKKSADRAIEGLKELGYHAEVAVESATEKLRCKVLSDLLFIQNIPPHIKENKLRDYFRPFNLLSCNILRDPKTEKSRGVGFIKVKDVRTAERLIEQFHGRVLGKDWKMPIQVSPAK
ncbi:hypothetical protein BCR41DRAFT_175869 [Lobosporangium transversale]|uniref:RRM domain-containing protein n=1 Tax=Lobosporangium transversale TaxID=64571 RepID=A0A1Y2GAX3_9FUNG|nr:hypothetical protein BCR41DRAFT_175869 [Lobosporangium transversale]ORZ05708.1 hypothetical protein BCR41DRAFT_175869 [Lobosporangium transversale]|eukprot:XP_021877195.1 hypothetical protein BCR41DRAFT_175869 [Lobosporangium transversale]